jgi:hypothetical protein
MTLKKQTWMRLKSQAMQYQIDLDQRYPVTIEISGPIADLLI